MTYNASGLLQRLAFSVPKDLFYQSSSTGLFTKLTQLARVLTNLPKCFHLALRATAASIGHGCHVVRL